MMTQIYNPLKEIWRRTKKAGRELARFFREEDLLKVILVTLKTQMTRSEKVMALLFLVGTVLIPAGTELVNHFGSHFDTINFLPWDALLPGSIFCLFICMKLREKTSYIGSIVVILFITIMSTIALASGATSILSTPFGSHDLSHLLLRFDLWLGFDQGALMNWVSHFPALKEWLNFAYFSITQQVALTALVMTIFCCNRSARLYITIILLCSLVAYFIYYFWPTFAPAYVIHNAIFPQSAAHLIERTQHIREHIPYQIYPSAGLIAFPSCHVIMGLSGIFCWITAAREAKKTWIKHLLIVISTLSVIINISLILATMLLGYHYLADVLASAVIFLVAWSFLYPMLRKEK